MQRQLNTGALLQVTGMHRLYSMFPLGLPGVGLVFLRLAVAITLWPPPNGLEMWLGEHVLFWGVFMLTLALTAGFVTPVAAALSLALKCVELARPGDMPVQYLACVALVSLALFLLGPGSYSLDSHLYGRRVLTVRPKR
jgi:hypothetical protein